MINKRLFAILSLLALLGGIAAGQVVLNSLPAKVYGQFSLPKTQQELAIPNGTAPNLVEGRELFSPLAVAVDTSVSPEIIYVVDTGNNRVLAWKDAGSFVNGAGADLVLGQRDFYSTTPQGPAGTFNSGFYAPSGVAVDRNGNVFVVDAGNNRILRFPKPFAQEDAPRTADLVIGQENLNGRGANLDAPSPNNPTEASIRTNGTGTGGVQGAGIAFDSDGNLWFSDSGNHRILRYAAADASGAGNSKVSANLVLGQADFYTATPNQGRLSSNDRLDKRNIRFGGPLTFDASGNLFFADDLGRVLMWKPPFTENGRAADRILGIYVLQAGQTPPPAVNDVTFGASANNGILTGGPRGVFCVGDLLFVVDTLNNRLVRYDPAPTWPEEDAAAYVYSPKMSAQFGQESFNTRVPNGGETFEPSAHAFSSPVAAAYANGEVFVVDSGNHRVLAMPYLQDANLPSAAVRVLGQYDFPFRSPNLIEGREVGAGTLPLVLPNNTVMNLPLGPAGAIDKTGDTPRLYIADTGNNRILGFADARRVKFGDTADLVIGQVDLYRSLMNSPINDGTKATQTGLLLPSSVAVDSDGNVWVADTGNGRVLRYPRPFDHWGDLQTADLVIGQPDFESRGDGTASRDRLYRPSSITFTGEGHLLVADLAHNRVLLYRKPSTNGQGADIVLGQPDGSSVSSGNADTQLAMPLGVAVDSDDRLYVADTGNNRILIFDRVTTQPDGGPSALNLPLAANGVQPAGVTVSARTGEIWVPDVRSSRVLRYPRFDQLIFMPNLMYDYGFATYGPRNIVLDATDNLFVFDSSNRITMHYPLHSVVNMGSGFPRVAPEMLALLQAPGVNFSADGAQAGEAPLPKELGDVELLVNGVPAPLKQVQGNSMRFIVPKSAPTSGVAEFLVRRVSTQEILAHNRIAMSIASPAVLFAAENPSAQAQARATNQDGSANTGGKPAAAGQDLTVYLTGHGPISGTPDDGVAPGSEIPVDDVRAFFLTPSGAAIEATQIVSAALDPNEPGVWRVKVKVPTGIPASGTYAFAVIHRSMGSNTVTVGNQVLRVNALVTLTR